MGRRMHLMSTKERTFDVRGWCSARVHDTQDAVQDLSKILEIIRGGTAQQRCTEENPVQGMLSLTLLLDRTSFRIALQTTSILKC